jgi:hypothetical protein
MSYSRTYPVSVGADAPAKPSLYNLLNLDPLVKGQITVEKKTENLLPTWVLWVGGGLALVTLLGAGAIVVRKRKAKP